MSKFTMVVAMGLVVLVVASTLMPSSDAASCDIFQLVPCLPAAKSARVAPSRQCCSNVAAMGKGPAGAECLCSLLNNPLAKSQGVQPRVAMTIPSRCRLPVPKGYKCNGISI